MRRYLALCAILLASCNGVAPTYVLADRATYEAVAPEYRAYVQADPALDEPSKERRLRTLETWRMRIEASEGKK